MQPPVSRAFAAVPSGKVYPFDLPKLPALRTATPESSAGRSTAERLLGLLTSSAVRKGSLEQMQFDRCQPELLRAIERSVRAGLPVQLTLMAFPFKTPNPAKVGPRRLPDLAELAALVRLHQLNARAKSAYPPGLEIHILHDGAFIAPVFGVALEEVRSYERYFSRLVASLDGESFIHLHDFQALLRASASDLGRWAARAHASIRRWRLDARGSPEWTDRFRKTLGMINLRGLSPREAGRLLEQATTGRLPAEHRELERRARVAMLRYRLRDSLLHTLDPRPACFPDAIHATTQCRPRRLAIWLVDRGRSLLPWHGVGVIDSEENWRVAPARNVMESPSFRPVFLEGEDTPFYYRQVA